MRKIVFLICVALGLACVQAKASKIALSADRTEVTPDGDVLAFVSLSVCDAAGRVVPRSNQFVKFSVEGATGKIVVRAESNGLKSASIELQSK